MTAQIESTWGFRQGTASVWLSDGDTGYRITLPVDLAESLCEFLARAS